MIAIITLILVLVITYFVYYGIVLPDVLQEQRHKLFELRDRLRRRIGERDPALCPKAYSLLQRSINSWTENIYSIDVGVIAMGRMEIRRNQELTRTIEKRASIIAACKDEEFNDILNEFSHRMDVIIMLNSAGVLVWVIPLVFIFACKDWLKKQMMRVLFMPELRVHHMPAHPAHP